MRLLIWMVALATVLQLANLWLSITILARLPR